VRNFFSYLRLPVSSNSDQLNKALHHVPDDEYDIHHVMSDAFTLTHYKRVHLQCTAMAVLLASEKDDDDILDKLRWRQRLSEFNVLEGRTESR